MGGLLLGVLGAAAGGGGGGGLLLLLLQAGGWRGGGLPPVSMPGLCLRHACWL